MSLAQEAFALSPSKLGVLVVTHLTITKPDRAGKQRQCKRIYERASQLAAQEQISELKQLLAATTWKKEPCVWWCETEAALGDLVESLHTMQHRVNQHGTMAYDISEMSGGRFVQVLLWDD